jgi:hypothetical protein
MTIGSFKFVLEKSNNTRTNQEYLHIYDGDKRISSYGSKLNKNTGKFESSMVLMEDTCVFEVINIIDKYIGSIKRVKINPNGYASRYSDLKDSFTLWERKSA